MMHLSLEELLDGLKIAKSSEGSLLIEIDGDGAWWLAECLRKADPDDAATQEIYGFVCDNF